MAFIPNLRLYTALVLFAKSVWQWGEAHGCVTDPGYDYSGHDVASSSASSADGCCAQCNAEPRCQFFSYATDGTNVCFMKSSNQGRQTNPDRISGTRSNYTCFVEEGYDYQGSDIGQVNATSAEQCCSSCDSNPQCAYFSYEIDNVLCLLKSSNAGRTANPLRISGGGNGPPPPPSPSPGPLPPVPDKLWFGWWGGEPDGSWNTSAESASLLFDPMPPDDVIDQYGGNDGLRFLYPSYMHFCQEQRTTGTCTLFPDYRSRWEAAVPKIHQYLVDGKILGLFIGDELICGAKQKTPVADWLSIISTVRSSFPRGTAILYTNECQSTVTSGSPVKTFPDELDWVSVDKYRSHKEPGFIAELEDFYKANVYPMMASHQKVAIIPEVTHDKHWDGCDDECVAKVELQDAKDAVDWQEKDSRVAFINPYRLDDLVTNKDADDLRKFWYDFGKGTRQENKNRHAHAVHFGVKTKDHDRAETGSYSVEENSQSGRK